MKLIQLKRTVGISAANYAAGNWTWTTLTPHYLAVGDTFTVVDPRQSNTFVATALAGTTGSTIVFASTDTGLIKPTALLLDNYGTGVTGQQTPFTFSFVDSISGLIHVVSNGTATTTVKAQGSLDGIHWIDIAAATAITAGSQLEIPVTKPYVYGVLNFTAAVASAGGGVNTIKAYKAGC